MVVSRGSPQPPAPSAPVAHGGAMASSGPTRRAYPTHQPAPDLAPDLHGADVGLAPDPVGVRPAVEVRIAESAPTDYARISTEQEVRTDDFSLAGALITMLEMRGSDLHLTAGAPPTVRVERFAAPDPGLRRS